MMISRTLLLFLLTRPLRGATLLLLESVTFRIFLLTRPLRGATGTADGTQKKNDISTHTPLAGRDAVAAACCML